MKFEISNLLPTAKRGKFRRGIKNIKPLIDQPMKNLHIILCMIVVLSGSVINGDASPNGPKDKLVREGCKCYTEGAAFSPGTKKCLGGHWAICVAKTGVGDEAKGCGWNYRKDDKGDYIKCP